MITNTKMQRVDGGVIGVAEFNSNHCLRLPKMLDDYVHNHDSDHNIDIPQHQRDDSCDLGLEDRDRFFLTDHVLCQPYPKPEADDATD